MGRYARIVHPGLTYHVINRGDNREVIFAEDEDYYQYLNTIERYKKKYEFKLFAFCLMTNHVHLLIKVGTKANISKIMQSITIAHTRFYNFKYQRCGHVWQGRFMSPIVSEDAQLLMIMRYIEQNPVRAKMVQRAGHYQWSSFRLNVRERESLLIDRVENKAFHSLGENDQVRRKQYRSLVDDGLGHADLLQLQESSRKGVDFISEGFKGQIGQLLPHKRKRGRPRINS